VVRVSLTNHDDNFIWSPDGTKIVFRHWTGEPNCVQDIVDPHTNLEMMNADGSGRHTIVSGVTYRITAWTADGSALVGVDPDTGRGLLVNKTTGASTPIGPLAADNPAISPDATGVAFVDQNTGRLHVANANGTGARDLGATSATDYSPAWSTDGGWLAWQRAVGTSNRILTLRLSGSAATTLYNTTSQITSGAVWSPDGARVAFSLAGSTIKVIHATGGSATSLSGTTDVRLLSWQP
jgi:Tol biopolymer transport system component